MADNVQIVGEVHYSSKASVHIPDIVLNYRDGVLESITCNGETFTRKKRKKSK